MTIDDGALRTGLIDAMVAASNAHPATTVSWKTIADAVLAYLIERRVLIPDDLVLPDDANLVISPAVEGVVTASILCIDDEPAEGRFVALKED